jgi:hypothetical protein
MRLDRSCHAFLEACRSGCTLAEASLACATPGDLATRFGALLAAGAFAADIHR